MNMSRILVTGSSGFIAKKLVERLKSLGHQVVTFDLVDRQHLRDMALIESLVKDVDVVYHLAAQADLTIMAKSLDAGRDGVMTNVQGTHNIAYACAKYNKWLIYASTVCVYGNVAEHPEKEDSTLPNPLELYATSKYAAEWIVRGYGYNYGMSWTSLRFATIYGEGMRPALGMHVFFTQALAGIPITVHGDGSQDRTLTYIDDLVDGIVAVLDHPEAKGQIFNLSSSLSVSAQKMAEDIKALTGSQSPIVNVEQRKNQTQHEDFDVSKAKNLLGWEAKTSWEDGLQKTYDWFKN